MEKTLTNLEKVLHDRYGFGGTFEGTVFSGTTEEAFEQLLDLLQNADTIARGLPDTTSAERTDNTPKIGDISFVYWHGHGWFTAKIENWLPDELNYMVRWTDGNWAAERANYSNLCVDKVPDASTIGVGTKVLFQQGLYWCGYNDDGNVCDSTGRTLSEEKKQEIRDKKQVSDRWHMGVITEIVTKANGDVFYNGKHADVNDPQVSHTNYVEYNSTFEGLTIEQLRTLPNIFNCLDSSGNDGSGDDVCDVFVSKVSQDNQYVKKILKQMQDVFNVAESKDSATSQSLQQTVGKIKHCKVYLVCLTDNFIADEQAMSELLYAKKSLGKTIIPLVLGTSHKWTQTTAGMLLAGQLYIQFASEDVYDEKMSELRRNLDKLIIASSKKSTSKGNDNPRVFLSYCWTNSKSSYEAEQVRSYTGHDFSDPRKIKADIQERISENLWLDIEQLDSVDDSGMFGQIAEGLAASSVVVMCVSKEYSKSLNCQMEANFAVRSLHKKAIILEVGSGNDEDRKAWQQSSVGMVLPTENEFHKMTEDAIDNEETYNKVIDSICNELREIVPAEERSFKNESENKDSPIPEDSSSLSDNIPMVGGDVIAHYAAWQFFPAKVASFDKGSMKYTVDWNDPDPACRVQPYNLVAVNRHPNENEIGVGSCILFKQGTYSYGGSVGDVWNLGEITSIQELDGIKLYSGKHSKTAADGLAVAGWSTFRPTFEQSKCEDLRLFPNVIELLQIYKNL